MIGELISRIRKEKKMQKTELAEKTNINIGHLTHIEKEERNPSHKTLKLICEALDIPYQPIMQTYDKDLTEEQEKYEACEHIKYDQIPVFNNLETFTKVPRAFYNASFAVKMPDNSMSPKIKQNEYIFIEINTPLSNKNIGLFEIENKLFVRKFIVRKSDEVIRAEDDNISEIVLNKNSKFNIIGKVVGKCDENYENFMVI